MTATSAAIGHEHLGLMDCMDVLAKQKYEFRDLPVSEPEDLVEIGLTLHQASLLVNHFHRNHPIHPRESAIATTHQNPVPPLGMGLGVTRQPHGASEEEPVQRPFSPHPLKLPEQDVVPNAVNLPVDAPNWKCDFCTFHNEGNPSSVCSMCNHPNPVKVPIPSIPPSDLSQVQTSPSRSSPTHPDAVARSLRMSIPPIMVQTGSPTHITMEFRIDSQSETGIRTEWDFQFNLKEVGGRHGTYNLIRDINKAIIQGEKNWGNRNHLTDYASLEAEFKNGIDQVMGKNKGWNVSILKDLNAYDEYVRLKWMNRAHLTEASFDGC